jgi:uncharacterized protein
VRLTEVSFGSAQPIQGYGPGGFRIGDRLLAGPCLITPWDAGPWGGLDDTAAPLTLAGRVDVLLLGLGAQMSYPPKGFVTVLEDVGIGVEPMTSPAACRTYNVLLGEGRRIAAALLPVG